MLPLIFAAVLSLATGSIIEQVGECGYPTKMYNLNSGDLMKVQSPQFPKTLTSPQSSADVSCSMSFTRADQTNSGLQFIFTNGYTLGFLFTDENNKEIKAESFKKNRNINERSNINFYDSNSNVQFLNAQNQKSLTYSYGTSSGGLEWSAFEAFVYAPENGEQSNSCWMNGKTFNLVDNTKTIPLFSKQGTLQNCSWTINVPDGMAMKMTVPLFSMHNIGAQVRVYPDGGDYISLGSGVSQVFYGKSFLVEMFASGAMKFEDDFDGFYALVSAVNKNPSTPTEFQCSKTENNDHSSSIGFFDPQNGYPNSAFCKVPLTVEPKKLMLLQAQTRYMEYLGEWIQIHNSQNDIIGDLMEYNTFSAENIDNFSLQLVTDENVKGAGFNVREFQVDCTCASNLVIIPCTGKYYAPILQADWTESTQTHTFCRGMNCSYQFEVIDDCGDSKIEIDVDFQTPGLQFNDIVGVNVDGTEVWNSTEGNTFTGQFGQKQIVEFFFNSADYKYEILNQIPVLLVGYSLAGQTSGSTMASPATAPPTMAPPSPTTGTGCPANAIQSIHKNQCFFVITNGKTFNDAENDCKTYGGHLASIHSAFDNILIDKLAKNALGSSSTVLIGVNDLAVNGVWKWTDGTTFDYNDFFDSSASESKHCAVMETGYGMWQQFDCNTVSNYVCSIST